MADDSFDPYLEWLDIPKHERPPTYYQLLAVSVEEQDARKISSATRDREESVRKHAREPHKALASSLLIELQEARATLLNPNSRARYDAQLGGLLKRQKKNAQAASDALKRGGARPVGEGAELFRMVLPVVGILGLVLGVATFFVYRHKFRPALQASSPPEISQTTEEPRPRIQENPSPPADPLKLITPEKTFVPPVIPPAQSESASKSIAQQFTLPESVNSIEMKLVLIPAGQFQMGAPENDESADAHERPRHAIKISKPFLLGKYEVSQKEWKAVMNSEPWKGKTDAQSGDDFPASYLSWNDAAEFCRKLSQKEKKIYRLPTEAEWEYACRANTETLFSFGDDGAAIVDYAWSEENAWRNNERYPHRIGQKKANPFGLHDMHGNVAEWCSDWFDAAYYSKSPATDPQGPAAALRGPFGPARACRGGNFSVPAHRCRTTLRHSNELAQRYQVSGFRVAANP